HGHISSKPPQSSLQAKGFAGADFSSVKGHGAESILRVPEAPFDLRSSPSTTTYLSAVPRLTWKCKKQVHSVFINRTAPT
ncbi:hypothetical protein V490_06810, partial [Pseudogymnoascus sp. VKM F-3557]